MAATVYTYDKIADAGRLAQEINSSTIIVALETVSISNGITSVKMKAELSQSDESTLNIIIEQHVPTPLQDDFIDIVRIDEGDADFTGGHTLIKGFHLPVENQGWNELDIVFPFNISVFSATWHNDATHYEDELELVVAPNTTIGQPTVDIEIMDTVINVQQSVIDNIAIGFYANLVNALNQTEKFGLGRVIAIDASNNRITIENPVDNVWNAATTLVQMSIKVAEEMHILQGGIEIAGTSKIGGSKVPAGTLIKARYYSKDEPVEPFHFHFRLQMSY